MIPLGLECISTDLAAVRMLVLHETPIISVSDTDTVVYGAIGTNSKHRGFIIVQRRLFLYIWIIFTRCFSDF